MRGIYLIIFLFILSFQQLSAQALKTISGTITDSLSGLPVQGATVHILHKNTTALTGDDGTFTVRVENSDTLYIHHVSYITKYLAVSGMKPGVRIGLVSLDVALQDVTINTGYQKLKPNETTGSYVVIDNKMLNQQTGTNILDRLNGVTSSLLFNTGKQNPNPQNTTNISIRGLSTINGPLDPLIVLDNFIYDGDINNINPNDVESITILKDAAAASIWGARAGNGVIVITTKKGRFNQKLQVDFNTDVILTNKPNLFYNSQISSSDYIDYQQYLFNRGYYNAQFTDYQHPVIDPAVQIFENRLNGLISAQDSAAQIDALKKIDSRQQFTKYYYREGLTQQYALNLHGGSQNLAWMLSGNYDKNTGNLRAQYNKLNLRFENTYRPVRNMNLEVGVYYTNSNNISGLNDYRSLVAPNGNRQVPYLKIIGANGQSVAVPHYYDPGYIDTVGAGRLLDWDYYPLEDYRHNVATANTEELLAHIGIDYHIVKGLDISLLYRYQKQRQETASLADTASFYARNLINSFSRVNYSTGVVSYIIPLGGILNKSYSALNSYNFRGQLNFDRIFNSIHHINAIAGMEVRNEWTAGSNDVYYGYNADPLTYTGSLDFYDYYPTVIGDYAVIPGAAALYATDNRFVSFFANASYTFKNKYTVSGSARRDGANVFGANTNDKWKPLWSAGLGWEISKERFYHIAGLPYLKLSATYGVSGNVDLSKTALPVGGTFVNNITGLMAEGINAINNPDLSWERSFQANIKLDFALAENRLTGSLEYYHKKGTNLYAPTPYDYTVFGRSQSITSNVANMKGNGVDVILHSNNINRQFKWTTDFLFNYNTSITTKYYGSSAAQASRFIGADNIITPVIGKPLYAVAAYRWGGLDAEGNPQGYLDGKLSEDYAGIEHSAVNDGLDGSSLLYIGPANPDYFGSLLNEFSYKGFSLSANITYKFHYYLFRSSLSYTSLADFGTYGNDYGKRWQHPGDEQKTNVPSFVYPLNSDRDGFYNGSEQVVIKGDHIRLQFINIAYAFLKNKSGLPFRSLKVYVNVANLGILWRANKAHVDPDYVNTVPAPKIYTIGANVAF